MKLDYSSVSHIQCFINPADRPSQVVSQWAFGRCVVLVKPVPQKLSDILRVGFDLVRRQSAYSLKAIFHARHVSHQRAEGRAEHVNENLYLFVMTNRYTFRPDTSNTYLVHLNHYHDRSFIEYSGDYESKQHLLNGQTIFRINYIREFGKKATLYVDPGISLMNYRLQNERMKYI